MTAGSLAAAVAAACGVPRTSVADLRSASGGDISQAHTARIDLADGWQGVFVKTIEPGVPGLLAAEAEGLCWLKDAGALRVPQVMGTLTTEEADAAELPEVLVLERLQPAPPAADHDEELGRGLAALHQAGCDAFGSPWPSFIGSLRQPRSGEEAGLPPGRLHAAEFLAHCRWWPITRVADERGALPPGTLDALQALTEVLPERLGHDEAPARIHGDLWAGNAMTDESGAPVLIDPSAHGGLREADLAMMRLFRGFSPTVFAAYEEAHPLPHGHLDRVDLHQIHPLLVHAALFGGGYGDRARAIMDRHR